ncbi:hypothetical protein MMC13_001804 [Lambiella insularis]|nr:hypothetical protein [Lambiella insularis]
MPQNVMFRSKASLRSDTGSICTLRWSSDNSEAFFSMYPVPKLPTSTSASTSMAKATEPTSWLSIHDSFVRSSAEEGEDAKTILILLETEFPTLQGKVNEEWVKGRMELRDSKEAKAGSTVIKCPQWQQN